MNRQQSTPNHKKTQSSQKPRGSARKGSAEGEGGGGLEELRDRGKKVLKRLIPSQPMVLIKKLVQKGAGTLKRQLLQREKLLPSLTLKNIQAELPDRPVQGNFQQMNQRLTHSMLYFLQGQPGEAEQSQILRLQTEKCYRKIPRCFFDQELAPSEVGRLLTRDRAESLYRRDQLGDFYDEVEFNVNQQVAYKMKVFMSFVTFLTSIGNLADLSLQKITRTRYRNGVVRGVVVQRSERVNVLRQRREEIQACLVVLGRVKKMKRLENFLMSQVQAKGRIAMAQSYQEYCSVHEQVKQYCCPRLICRFWDVAYYVQRGYHDSFSRSLKSYLRQIIVLDQNAIKSILTPKQDFQTVSNPVRVPFSDEVSLDQSYEVDQGEVQLVTKHNIEREIVSIFRLGLRKCTYSTDQICAEIKTAIQECFIQLFRTLRGDQTTLQPRPVSETQRKGLLQRLPLGKYVRVVQQWSSRMQKVVRRQGSVVQKALQAAKELRIEFPEKQEVIATYLMQILEITFVQVDDSLAFLLQSRKLKPHEAEPVRQLILCTQQWRQLFFDFRNCHCIWEQWKNRFDEGEGRALQGLLGKSLQARRKVVELMVDVYSKTSVQNLPLRLQQQQWKTVTIPSRYYTTLGEVIYGPSFSKHIQSVERKLLSSSLLLQRNSSLLISQDYQPTQAESGDFDLQVSQTAITLRGESHRVVGSSLAVVDFLHGYLEWVGETGEGELLEETVLSKIMEFLLVYNENVRKLILGKEALNYGLLKSKSITAKHLVTAYSQLKLLQTITNALSKRLPAFAVHAPIVIGQLQRHMSQISKKFRAILQLAINESINRMVVDPRKPINGPVPQTIQIVTAVNRSTEYIKQILQGGSKEMSLFVGVGWCGRYLQQLRAQYRSVYKNIMNSNGTRKGSDIDWTDNIYWKFKQLQYVVQNLQEHAEYLPGFDNIEKELEGERKKLENPQ